MEEIIKILGFLALLVSGVTYLAKLIITNFFNYQAKKLEHEHHIIFSNLHVERAKIINELYALIVETENKIKSFNLLSNLISKKIDEGEKEEVSNAIIKLSNFFERNRIYFSENVCDKVLNIINLSADVYLDIRISSSVEFQNNDQSKSYSEVNKKIKSEIKNLRTIIEIDFRKLLGVT
jgi:hypothetical protein